MCHVEHDSVEASAGGSSGGGLEAIDRRVHVVDGHLSRDVATRGEGDRGSGQERPSAFTKGPVDAFAPRAGRTSRAGVAELEHDLGIGLAMQALDDLSPFVPVLVRIEAGRSRRDPSFGRDRDHLRQDKAGPASCGLQQLILVGLVRHPVHRSVLAHR